MVELSQCVFTLLVSCLHLGYLTHGVAGELCLYTKALYDPYNSGFHRESAEKECQWGCCSSSTSSNSPCCTLPLTLIIGCAIGGLGFFSFIMIIVFSIIYCRRKREERARAARRRRRRLRQSSSTQPLGLDDSIFYSDASLRVPGMPPPLGELPPSYDEVMASTREEREEEEEEEEERDEEEEGGQNNEGFKPEDDPV